MYAAFLAGALALGVVLGDGFSGAVSALILLAGLAALAWALARRRIWAGVSVALVAAAGLLGARAAWKPRAAAAPETPLTVEAVLARPVEYDSQGRAQIVADLANGVRVRITLAQGSVALLPGDLFRLAATFHLPQGFANPGGFDVARSARAHGIDYVAGVPSAAALARLRKRPCLGPWRPAGAARAWLRRFIARSLPPGRPRGLLLALTIGDRSEVDAGLDDAFRDAGVTHVLSVSGLHLAVAALLFYAGLRRLLLRIPALALRIEARRLAAALSIPAVLAYTATTGAAIATCRSAVMAIAFFLGIAGGRQVDARAALGMAGLLLLGHAPLVLFDPSLQLTFAATAALCLIAPRLAPAPAGRPRRFIAASVAATIATAPIAAYHFHQLAPAALAGNLLVVPLCELLVLPVALLALALAPLLPALAELGLRAAALGARGMALGAHWVQVVRPAFPLGTPRLHEIALFYAILAALLCHKRRLALAAAATLLASVTLAQLVRAGSTDLVLTFLDVGQGDAIVGELPGGRAILVDGGGSFDPAFDPGERVIEPYLRWRHISRLDLVILSHPHPDHMNGLPRILERFDVRELWEPGEPSQALAYARLQHLADAHTLARGPPPGAKRLGAVAIDVLGPRGGWSLGRSTNDNSLVLRLRYAAHVVLLPGDIERASEAELVGSGSPLRADVLKAPHHGSRTSSTPGFLHAVAPSLAIFTAGRGNRFGFPHPDVVGRYACPTRTTGRDGAVTVTLHADGTRLVRSFLGGQSGF